MTKLSVGVRGAHTTFRRSGARTTVGIPGTGLSYSAVARPAKPPPSAYRRYTPWVSAVILVALMIVAAMVAHGTFKP
jgi:hypothetical protein